MTRRRLFTPRVFLIVIGVFQIISHLFWLPIAAHSGQVAIPWMMNQGATLFDNLLEQHAPGSSLIVALAQQIMPFQPVDVARILNVMLVLATTGLVYILAKHLSDGDERAGVAAVCVWFWWEPVYGNILFYFDTILGFLILLALVIWVQRNSTNWYLIFIVGLLMGGAAMMKQHAWGAVLLFLLWMIVFHRVWRDILLYLVGTMLIPIVLIGWIASQGNLETYIYWNWTFNLSGIMDSVPLDGDLFRKLLLTNMLAFPFLLMALQQWRSRSTWLLVFLIWGATTTVLYPRFGEIHAMAHLPFLAVMSGVVLGTGFSRVSSVRQWWREAQPLELIVAGLVMALGIGWMWTGAVSYIPLSIGTGATLAHDEYIELVAEIKPLQEDDDTLFVLPETDSTPQLHPMTGMMPSGTWIKGWHWYFEAPGVTKTLLDEWEQEPPSWIAVFPDLVASGEPGILELLNVVEDQYELIFEVDDVFLHGSALVYRVLK